MHLDEIPKIRSELFNVLEQYFAPLKVGPTPAVVVHVEADLGQPTCGKAKGPDNDGHPLDFSDEPDPRLLWGKVFDVRRVGDYWGNTPGELINLIGLQLFALYLPLFAMEGEFLGELLDQAVVGNN